MIALCNKRETPSRNRIRQRARTDPSTKLELCDSEELYSSPDCFPLLMETTQWPDCLGDERLRLEERTFLYCRPTIRNDHFDKRHLPERERVESRGEPIRCEHPRCRDEKFEHLDDFRSYI